MKRYALFGFVALPILLIIVPAVLVLFFTPLHGNTPSTTKKNPDNIAVEKQIPIKVYRVEKEAIESIPLERYVEGVISAEMPAEFELEALKAQALAVRTYMIRRLQAGHFEDVPQGGHVLDTIKHQVYMDDQQRREQWGEQYQWKQERIHQAVQATAGVVLTYQGEPIDATFFSTSNGFTENANEYWERSIPYLKSVASPWDTQSPRFEEQKVVSTDVLEKKLGIRLELETTGGSWYQVLERTTGNRIGRVRIGNKEFSGREIRESLGLNSSAFTMVLQAGRVVITTRGYGHGVGMSQWGANGMAKAGKSAEQIVKYFYQGISLQNYQSMMSS